MRRLCATVGCLFLVACTVLVSPPDAGPSAPRGPAEALQAYTRVLERFVDERGRVDFAALARDRDDLDAYVRFIADAPLETFAPGDERLAHYINSYNALSMFNVIESGIPRTHAGWHKVVFFVLHRFWIGGQERSLYAYENDVIRKVGDPRVHFALNCSALGCPLLPRRPFTPKDLQRELDRETRRFFLSPGNLRIDPTAKVAHVSELLSFYREDFVAGGGTLIGFVNRYAPDPIPGHFDLRFIPYDWTVADSHL